MKKTFLLFCIFAACAFVLGQAHLPSVQRAAFGQTAESKSEESKDEEELYGKEITPEIRKAIEKGLAYMASRQDTASGAFDAGEGAKLATTAICGMALLAGGNTPGRGKYGKNVTRAVKFVLQCSTMRGYLQYASSNMYSHGFGALFLAEVYGMIPPYETELGPKVKKKLSEAIRLLEDVQNAEGGWWYNPVKTSSQGADISVTVCETMALRAARNAGIYVDKRVVKRAIDCVLAAANADGGFSYRVYGTRGSGGSAFPRSAGGVCILQGLGEHNHPATKAGLKYLMRFLPSSSTAAARSAFYFYGAYYSTQAMFSAGGVMWEKWYSGISKELLAKQSSSGSWAGGGGGEAYSTGMALIVLQLPYRYLPVLEAVGED
ncbi:MAG: prenyltransferase/squalene oxidase repeat-containing protein [Planctomycetota bacterium]